jgi:hypothetical protein
MAVRRESNEIRIYGKPGIRDVFYVSSAYHQAVRGAGYRDVILDFSECENVFERFLLPVVCLARSYMRDENAMTELIKPRDSKLAALFHNANWEHLISPAKFQQTTYEGSQHVPAIQFFDADGHYQAVDQVLDAVLGTLPSLSRDSLKALKWSLDEITDNVLNHASSGVGGFLQATSFSQSGCVEFVVADAGIGIPRSLGMQSHQRAIEKAVQEGITRNKATNRGNGLFGAFQIANLSGGSFEIVSGHGYLTSFGQNIRFGEERQLYPGTVVASRIDCSKPDLLHRALRFGGEPHEPAYDYIEQVYENAEGEDFVFKLDAESASLGSREAAGAIVTKLNNLLKMNQSGKIIVDFNDVFIISSSFADEVFGKLFKNMGPTNFMNRISLVNMDETVRALIDRAIHQRMTF